MSEITDENPWQELLDEIISSLEPLEARSDAIYQFLKAKGGATDEDLAPFLEQAANASNVRWRAFRVRAESLIAGAMKALEQETNAATQKAQTPHPGSQPAEQTPEERAPKDASATQEPEKSGAASSAGETSRSESGEPRGSSTSSPTGTSVPQQDGLQPKHTGDAPNTKVAQEGKSATEAEEQDHAEVQPQSNIAA